MKISSLAGCIFLFIFFPYQFGYSQQAYEPPKLSDPNSWVLIMVPDTQTYVKFGRNQGILELMTAWIAENIQTLNIKMVLCTGDLVEQNELIMPNNANGNQTSREQWLAVSNAFDKLDGKIPYILAAGNHDYGYINSENRNSYYNTYFPSHKNSANIPLLRAAANNGEGKPSLENAAHEWISPHGDPYLFLNLEFAPRDTIVSWAKEVIGRELFKNHKVALLTHSYLNANNEHIEKENYPVENGNYGKALWEKLVFPSHNIQLVFSGHIGAPDNFEAHTAYRKDVNASGKIVNQVTFNAQAMGGGWNGNGGDGWLRIMEFLPDKKTVLVSTFSPFFAISPSTRHLAYQRGAINTFKIVLD